MSFVSRGFLEGCLMVSLPIFWLYVFDRISIEFVISSMSCSTSALLCVLIANRDFQKTELEYSLVVSLPIFWLYVFNVHFVSIEFVVISMALSTIALLYSLKDS
jgi:hypothetical protein